MVSNKAKIVTAILTILILGVSVLAYIVYLQKCEKELHEVDRYATPYIAELMTALSTWDFKTLSPYLTERYRSVFTEEGWNKELKSLSALGELHSYLRPRFVSHTPFNKYWICKSAIDVYSVSTKFENDRAVVRIYFENDCGKLKVKTIKFTSALLKRSPY